jgi:hypothetical protein
MLEYLSIDSSVQYPVLLYIIELALNFLDTLFCLWPSHTEKIYTNLLVPNNGLMSNINRVV